MVLKGKSQLWPMWLDIHLIHVYWEKLSAASGNELIWICEVHSGLSFLLSSGMTKGVQGRQKCKGRDQVCSPMAGTSTSVEGGYNEQPPNTQTCV